MIPILIVSLAHHHLLDVDCKRTVGGLRSLCCLGGDGCGHDEEVKREEELEGLYVEVLCVDDFGG